MSTTDKNSGPEKRVRALVIPALFFGLLWLGGCSDAQLTAHGRFANIGISQPQGTPKTVVLLLADSSGGPSEDTDALARALAAKGALVATLDTGSFLDSFSDEKDCSNPDGDLDNLGRYLEAAYDVAGYRPPILVGVGQGATLAFAAMAQATRTTFAGALALDFDPATTLPIEPCPTGALAVTKANHGVSIRPAPQLGAPWFVLARKTNVNRALEAFIDRTGQAQLLSDINAQPDWSQNADLARAYRVLKARQLARTTKPLDAEVADLPLIKVPTARGFRTNTLAIVLSGDGGWADLDRSVGKSLAKAGMPVVGFDSLRYFWNARTPEESARDLARMIDYYRAKWHKPRVLLVGYSFGADVLPFMVNRLPQASRQSVTRIALLGLGADIDFEIHVSSWLPSWLGFGNEGLPVPPEVRKLPAGRAICIYGVDDSESICQQLDPSHIRRIALPGGHHFDGDYANLARLIMGTLPAADRPVSDKQPQE